MNEFKWPKYFSPNPKPAAHLRVEATEPLPATGIRIEFAEADGSVHCFYLDRKAASLLSFEIDAALKRNKASPLFDTSFYERDYSDSVLKFYRENTN